MPAQSPDDTPGTRVGHLSQGIRKPSSGFRSKLVKILALAQKDLEKESRPHQPLSVFTKAEDLARNLPHWEQHFIGLAREIPHVDRAFEACQAVIKAAQETIRHLKPHVEAQVGNHQNAEEQLKFLSKEVRAAIAHIRHKEEFKS